MVWVLMEVRAAEIAEGAFCGRRGRPVLGGDILGQMSDDELDGWTRADRDSAPIHNPEHQTYCAWPIGWVKSRLAGWMAYQIASTP